MIFSTPVMPRAARGADGVGMSSIRYYSASACLLYTSDAADERSSVDLGGRRILKKKKTMLITERYIL